MKLHSYSLIFIITSSLFLVNIVSSDEPPISCDELNPSTKSYPFCDTKLPISQRVNDLVSRLTLDEKISQLVNTADAIPRLNISSYQWWSEALHGVSRHGKGIRFNGTIHNATMFPQVILTAASFDAQLWYRISQAIGKEARAMYNSGQAMGMTYWTPTINIFRDPRWGRGQETPGEDPLMVGKYAVSYVRGIQGDSFEGEHLKNGEIQASACCKHFTAHDLDNWDSIDRYTFNANVTKQDLADTYQPPFEACIQQGKATGLMCAYNRVNGVPNCADYNLLTETARKQWGFQGYIVSDCDAVAIMHDNQGYAKLPEDAVAYSLKAGMDLNCGSYLKKYTKSAIQQKKVSTSEIDRALYNLFSVRMRLGLLNGDPKKLAFGNIGPDQVCSKEHQDLALEAARNGIVLLKNSNGLLPFSKNETVKLKLAVIGPNANTSEPFLGNYEGWACKNITILQALQGYTNNIVFHQGCDDVNCTKATIDEAVAIATEADYVVMVMGLDQTREREKLDRVDLVLPGEQESLVTRVAQNSKKPIVLVLLNGGPLDVSFAKVNDKIGSILWAGYPGESGGVAVSEIIFGDHNPGGKLPVTWYPKEFVKVAMTDMRMRSDTKTGYPGRTYRFYTGEKVYEFGYGLSYTSYKYEFTSVSINTINFTESQNSTVRELSVSAIGRELCRDVKFSAIVGVKNDGKLVGKHPVLLFVKTNMSKKLIGFESVRLNPGERSEIKFEISPCEHLSEANEDGLMVIQQGIHTLVVGEHEYHLSVQL